MTDIINLIASKTAKQFYVLFRFQCHYSLLWFKLKMHITAQ